MKLRLTLFLCFTCSAFIHSQSLEIKLKELFESRYEDNKSGASILISKNGNVIFSKQIGLANIEHNISIKPISSFSIGSITKQFTAAAILLLEEKGALSLSDSIGKYLPSFDPSKYPVTIQQLLIHSSGIPDYPRISAIRQQIRSNLTPQQIIDLVQEEPLKFDPGTEMSYSNSGYLVLGLIIEKVSGITYGEFMEKHIFNPLEMHSTIVCSYENIIPNRANGYSEDYNDQIINSTPHSASFSAGAIVSIPDDMNKWIFGLVNYKIISQQSLDKMFKNYSLNSGHKTNLGLGWEVNEIGGLKTYEHSGFEPGYKANSVYIPDEKLYILVMQNNEYGSPTPSMIKAAAICLGRPYPVEDNEKLLSENQKLKFVGTYLFENEEKKFIELSAGNLQIKSPGGSPSKLFTASENRLFYTNSYRQLNFEEDFKKVTYTNRIARNFGTKSSDEVPEEKKELKVPQEVLQKFIGEYKFEAFKMTISLDNGALHAQPEGSNKLPLTPESLTKFFIQEMGAEIEFISNAEGDVLSIEILQEGNKMTGERL